MRVLPLAIGDISIETDRAWSTTVVLPEGMVRSLLGHY